jgi:hypothetical protein
VFKADKDLSPEQKAALGDKVVFSNDNVHPLDAGHMIYAEVAARHLPTLVSGTATKHDLGKPLRDDNTEMAQMLPLDRATLGEGWEKLDPASNDRAKSFGNRMPVLYRAQKPGTKLSFRFRGSAIGIYDLVGPDCGQLLVSVDGGAPKTVPRIDGYCTYHRIAVLRIASGLPDGEHRVEVTLDANVPDKAKILFEHNRPDLEKNPAKYAGTNWFAGGIMLIGSPLP